MNALPDEEIASAAIYGVAAEQAGRRAAPKSSIQAIYLGARALNCIAAVARYSDLTDPKDQLYVLAAINEIKISTRSALVLEVADASAILKEVERVLRAATPPSLSLYASIGVCLKSSSLAGFK